MYKNILQALLMAIALLSIHTGPTGADIAHSATPSSAEYQVEHAVYTQAGEGPVFTKSPQNVPTGQLHKVEQAGDATNIAGFLHDGHDANELDQSGFTPLFWAAFAKDVVVSLRCAWPAYGMLFTFREGKDLVYISLDDGDVTE